MGRDGGDIRGVEIECVINPVIFRFYFFFSISNLSVISRSAVWSNSLFPLSSDVAPSFSGVFCVQSKFPPPRGQGGQTWTTDSQICSTHTVQLVDLLISACSGTFRPFSFVETCF